MPSSDGLAPPSRGWRAPRARLAREAGCSRSGTGAGSASASAIPARIFFAPRAFDYAVEAVEGWFEEALGAPWTALRAREGLDAKVFALDCEYERPLVEGDEIEVAAEVAAFESDAITVRATGLLPTGERSFRAEVALALVERDGDRRVGLTPERRARLEALLARGTAAGGSAAAARGEERPRPPLATPFTRSRRVHHGDCTASGDVYAPRVAEWAAETVGEWYAETLGISWSEQCRRGRGTPFLGIRCEIARRLEPGTALTLAVSIPRLGNSSIGYAVVGADERGTRCFEARMSACYISDEGGRRSMPFPDALRERIVAFQAACRGAPPPGS